MANPGKNQLSTSWRDFLNLRAGGRAVLITLVSPLVADAAVKIFLSGSPHQFQLKPLVRWRVAITLAAYFAPMDFLWQRMGWATKAAVSFFVLFGLLTFIAWVRL